MSEENLERLEREIASLCPKGMPAGILERLGTEMEAEGSRTAWGDRCLVGAIGAGVAASVVIVSMLWVQAATTGPAPAGGAAVAAGGGSTQRVGDSLAVYARVEGQWGGIVK